MQNYSVEEQGIHNRDFVNFQLQNIITRLFKNDLSVLDFLKSKYQITKEDADEARKRILDQGNASIREAENLIDVFDFYINPERLKLVKQPKKIIKKFVTGGHYYVE